ncbi:MAG: hypothetical protein ABH846_00325 [Patescibacteria group bacterium]
MRALTTAWAVVMTALLMHTGCGDPDDSGKPDDTGDTSVTTNSGTLTGEVYILGVAADCDVNLNGNYAGKAWEPIERDVGTYGVTAGDVGKTTQDDLPIHSQDGRDWVAPEATGKVDEDIDTPVRVDMNQYVEGTWSCWVDDGSGMIYTGVVEMDNGHLLTLPGLGQDMDVTGVDIYYHSDQSGSTIAGAFTSATTADLTWTTAYASAVVECWKGGQNDRP